MTLLIVYLLLALVVSFVCSITEAVFLSARTSFVFQEVNAGKPYARRLLRQQAHPDGPLSAILTLNTIAHTVGAAGAGAQAAVVFGSAYVGVFSAVLTLLILFLSEIVPKTLGATHWQTLARPVTLFIAFLAAALAPFVWVSRRLTMLLSHRDKGNEVSRDEIIALAEVGASQGEVRKDELAVVRNVLKLDRLQVRDIMTPRTVVFSLSQDLTVSDFFARHSDHPFSRIPVYADSPDEPNGLVLKQDLMHAQAEDAFDTRLAELRRDFLAVPPTLGVGRLLRLLLRENHHIALVFDEYGGFMGVVTLEDVFETLLGLEILDETDEVADLRELARRRRALRGSGTLTLTGERGVASSDVLVGHGSESTDDGDGTLSRD